MLLQSNLETIRRNEPPQLPNGVPRAQVVAMVGIIVQRLIDEQGLRPWVSASSRTPFHSPRI